MLVDAEIKMRGLEALSRSLGLVDAERFVCSNATGSTIPNGGRHFFRI